MNSTSGVALRLAGVSGVFPGRARANKHREAVLDSMPLTALPKSEKRNRVEGFPLILLGKKRKKFRASIKHMRQN